MSGSITELFRQAVDRNPAAAAIIAGGRVISFGQLWQIAMATAGLLHERGLRPGDFVALTMERHPLHLATMLGLARLGVAAVPLHAALAPAVKARLAEKFGIRAVLADSKAAAIEGLPLVLLESVSSGDRSDAALGNYSPDASTPFRVMLTSGTTGEPKGMLYTHGDFIRRMEASLEEAAGMRLVPPNLLISVGAIYPLRVLCCGGTIVFPESNEMAATIAAVQLHAVTHILLSPWAAAQLLELAPQQGLIWPSIRHLRLVGGPASEMVLRLLSERISPRVYMSYGLTELGVVAIATPEELLRDPAGAGRLRLGVRLEIVDDQEQVLPLASRGQVRVWMEPFLGSYYREPAAVSAAFRDGWYYPGDIGRLADDGMLFLEGRVDDILNIGGSKVAPGHIEQILQSHPGVHEAVVFADGDEQGLTGLIAAVMASQELTSEQLRKHFLPLLGDFTPAQFVVLEKFPRNPSGKTMRREVIDLARQLMRGGKPQAAADGRPRPLG